MRFEFVSEENGLEVLRDKVTDEVLARVTVITQNGVTLTREDDQVSSKTFPVTNTSQILGGTHLTSLLDFLGKSSKDPIIP